MASSPLCRNIIGLNLGTSEEGIVLYRVLWNALPPGTQAVCVQYRITGGITPDWINAITNLQVDIYGNIEDSSFVVLANPVPDISYDIKAFSQCGGIAFETTFIFPSQVYSGSYLTDYAVYNICGNDAINLFSDIPFQDGAIMYTDVELTTAFTGASFIADAGNGIIHSINSGTGEVGAATAYSCNQSNAIQVMLSNNSSTICCDAITEVYSSGIAQEGSILYTDPALSIPVTTFDYVFFVNDNIIYNLDSVTGTIETDTGLTCAALGNFYQYSVVYGDIESATPVMLYTPGAFGNHAIMYTDCAMTTPLTTYNYISFKEEIRTIDDTTGEVGCIAVNC